MSPQAWITLAVVAVSLWLMVRDVLPPAVVMLGAAIVLVVTRVLTPEAAFAGFANPAPLTVAALYVLARAVEITGALDPLLSRVLGNGQNRSTRAILARLLAPVAGASAFLNNTPIVAMTAPQVAAWSEQRGRSAAPLLMPLSFATILGGVVTSIGTSTNLVVSGMLVERGMAPFGLFEIARVGLPVALAGLVLLIVLAPIVLRRDAESVVDLKEQVREFSVDMRVIDGGPLVGLSVEEAGLRHLQGVYLVRIERNGHVIAPVDPRELLQAGDVLSFVGNVDLIVDLQRMRGLASTEEHHLYGIDETRQSFFEVVLGSSSSLVGSTLKETGFRARYDAAVLAVHRAGQRVDAKLGELRLRAGDTLLLLADTDFRKHWRESGDFLVVAPLRGTSPARTRKAPMVLALTALLVFGAGSGLLPILDASLLIAVALVATGVLTLREARDAVDLNVILLIGAAFGLGAAMEQTGLAAHAANLLLSAFSFLGAAGALLGVVVTTIVLTEMVTNNAAAVLMLPIALPVAQAVGADPRAYAIAVAVAASASFLTPIGYQTNTIVYGLGGYRFSDYPRLGLPLTALVVAAIVGIVHYIGL